MVLSTDSIKTSLISVHTFMLINKYTGFIANVDFLP